MKNKAKKTNSKGKEICFGETVEVMETILFTSITERVIKSQPILVYYDFLDFIAFENKLKANFSPFFACGKNEDIVKTQDLFINALKYN